MGMKRAFKTAAVVLLACNMLLFSFPGTVFSVDWQTEGKKGEDFSENTYISEKLQVLFDALVYSDAPYFTVSGKTSCRNVMCSECALAEVCTKHPYLKKQGITFDIPAYGSDGFARYVLALIFDTKIRVINQFGNPVPDGSLQTVGRVASSKVLIVGDYDDMTEENLKEVLRRGTPGDLVQARSVSGGGHSMILLAAGEDEVYLLHSIDSTDDAEHLNRVVISCMTYTEMIAAWGQVISLIRVDDESYRTAWAKGETVHKTHIYTDAGQNACTVCGETVSPQTTVAGAGVYMAHDRAEIYKGFYRSTGTNGTSVEKGKFIEVVGSVVNSTGKTFYLLAGGGYAAGEDFETATGNLPVITIGTYPMGTLPTGKSYNLSGEVRYSSGLSYVAGYLLGPGGEIVQSVKATTSSSSYNIYSGTINAQLRFASLAEGSYVYMITACGRDGAMSAFKSEFTMAKQAGLPTPPAPSMPTLSSKTSTTVTLKSVPGYEYRLGSGGTWKDTPIFTGLQPGTTYSFYQRVAATSQTNASPSSPALSVTTDKGSASAPSAPMLSSKTSTTVTLKSVPGYEYKRDSENWQISPIFTGLQPGTTHKFYQRVAATSKTEASLASPALSVTTDKESVPAPSAPRLSSSTPYSVMLQSEAGCEYRKGTDGAWQNSPFFNNLQPNTVYSFYRRTAETSTSYASPASVALTVTTPKKTATAVPPAPTVKTVEDTMIELNSLGANVEYSRNGGQTWQKSTKFSGLISNTSYSFVARYAEIEDTYAGPTGPALTVKTDYSSQSAPLPPTLRSVAGKVVTLVAVSGQEYSMDGGRNWQASAVFTVPTYGTYSFIARKAANDRCYASPASSALTVTVNPTTLTSDKLTVREDKKMLMGVNAGTSGRELLQMLNERDFVTLAEPDGGRADLSSAVKSGMTLTLPGGERYILVVKGDIDGDGVVSVFDLAILKRYIIDGTPMAEQFFLAADVNEDGEADIFDYTAIRRNILDGGRL